ncbi:Sfum_1244 family protein [Sulfuritalea sp.]|uniref:Sfum_1244 family protein n=1 Tax=Sulfuritalea sp. TaxID=2480090 RepID=UPI00286E1ACE|nr:Sfum_1244 family protein [Sulfuritalea sp.]
MIAGMAALVNAVQTNCDIADARHARDVSLCTYLLGMREFYRWEHQLPYGVSPPRDEVGRWIAEREARWELIAADDFVAVPVAGREFDPFAAQQVNAALAGSGLVYGAGLGRFHKPHFFLGQLDREEQRGEALLLVCGCEYARDVSAIPAASQGATLIVRREALRQWLWEKAEGWNVKQQDGALKSALLGYGFDVDPQAAIERMTDGEIETLVLHEEGEFAAGRLLGHAWADKLAGFSGKRAELLARAVRDNLADCLVTLPALLQRDAADSLHFWFSTFDGLRRELFPRLVEAYGSRVGAGDPAILAAAATAGRAHFTVLGRRLLDLDEAGIETLSHAPASISL